MNILDNINRRVRAFLAPMEGRNLSVDRKLLDLARGFAGASLGGVTVTEQTALNFVAVYAAQNILATDTAVLPLKVYRTRLDGGRDEARDHPVYELLAVSPDGETTSMRWRQAWVGHVLGWGNGYAEIRRRRNGLPARLHLLDPATTQALRTKTGSLTYSIQASTRKRKTLPPSRVLHFAGYGFDGLSGYSPITRARQAVALGMAAERFGTAFFGNTARPGGVIELPQRLDDDKLTNFRSQFQDLYANPDNAGRWITLLPGMKATPLQITPEDAQFLATRQFQITEIARLYRLPPHKLADLSNAHLSNIEESNLDYLMTSLMPWLEAMEQELNWKLFTPEERAAGLFVEHNMAALLRGNMNSRADFYTKMRDLGVLNPNQIARRENLDPIGPEGEVRLVPGNMVPLESAGAQMGAAVAEDDEDQNEDAPPAGDAPEEGPDAEN